jgi:ribokinase
MSEKRELMARIAVAGLVNVETTLRVDGFPLEYQPIRFAFGGVNSTVSGVGYNVSRALSTLGNTVDLMTLIGDDAAAALVRSALSVYGMSGEAVQSNLQHTPQSVVMYEPSGRRAIFTDLMDIQEAAYPAAIAERLLDGADLAVLCNINFSRPILVLARARGLPIATDVHAISDIHDAYNRDYISAATVLFQSHERLPCEPWQWIHALWDTYQTPVSVIGMGEHGALLGLLEGRQIIHVPAVTTRPIVSTVGAGDALFSAFVHIYAQTYDPFLALKKAVVFASYKIGVAGGAEGFLDADGLETWFFQVG